jgi:hypothetical protein
LVPFVTRVFNPCADRRRGRGTCYREGENDAARVGPLPRRWTQPQDVEDALI